MEKDLPGQREEGSSQDILIMEDGETTQPFSPDTKMPSSDNLNSAYERWSYAREIDNRAMFSFLHLDPQADTESIGFQRAITVGGTSGIIEVKADFAAALEDELIEQPLGDVEFRRVSRDGKMVIEAVPLTFTLGFEPQTEEQVEALYRRRVDFALGGKVYAISLFSDLEKGVANLYGQPQLQKIPIGSEKLKAGTKTVVIPFDPRSVSQLTVTSNLDDTYDRWKEHQQQIREERERVIFENTPPVIKQLRKGFEEQKKQTETYQGAETFTQVPLDEYLKLLAGSGMPIHVLAYTATRRDAYVSGSARSYIITDGLIQINPQYPSGSQLHDIESASYSAWIKTSLWGEKQEPEYFLRTRLKADELRRYVKQQGITSLQFTCEASSL